MSRRVFPAALLAICAGCTAITEELPVTAPTPSTPPPLIVPAPQPGPTATPQPTPQPTTKPSGNPVASVTAGVHSIRRGGQLYRNPPKTFKPADALYLNCTPRDASGQPTHNHGPIQAWRISSTNLQVGRHFHYTDTNTFNPDLHIHLGCPAGEVTARCQVDGFWSQDHVMPVRP